MKFFEVVAMDFDAALLPALSAEDLAKPTVVAACGNLHQLIHCWMNAGAAIPFNFNQLAQEAVAGHEAKQLVMKLLGEQRSLWYADEEAQDTDLVPRQVVLAIYGVLENAEQQYHGIAEAKAAAVTCYAKISEQHGKRARTSE